MPITLVGAERLGLGLWNSVPGTLAVELAIFGAGLTLYTARHRAARSHRILGLWGLVGFMLVVVHCGRVRAAAADRRGGGVVSRGDVAARRMGLLGR